MALGDTVLREGGKEGKEVAASELWAEGPVLVVILRRPGCRECPAAPLARHRWSRDHTR
jgi:hypothetical protein